MDIQFFFLFHLPIYISIPLSIMSDYFNPSDACPKSKDLLLHSTVTTIRCGPYTLLNPNYVESPPAKLPERGRSKPSKEVIELDESPALPNAPRV
jgi:hypothetical protein